MSNQFNFFAPNTQVDFPLIFGEPLPLEHFEQVRHDPDALSAAILAHREEWQHDLAKDGPMIEIQPNWIMAHVMHEAGIFPSVGQARKNGWDKPIPTGFSEFVVTKRRVNISIWNPANADAVS